MFFHLKNLCFYLLLSKIKKKKKKIIHKKRIHTIGKRVKRRNINSNCRKIWLFSGSSCKIGESLLKYQLKSGRKNGVEKKIYLLKKFSVKLVSTFFFYFEKTLHRNNNFRSDNKYPLMVFFELRIQWWFG